MSALETIVWDFRTGGDAGQWDIQGFAAPEQLAEGVRLSPDPSTGGRMIRVAELPAFDAIRLVFSKTVPGGGSVLWHPRKLAPNLVGELKFALAGQSPETVEMNVSQYADWDADLDAFGFQLDPGSDVVLDRIELLRWSPLEKIQSVWQSFWHFDHFFVYSINFLWGPILQFTPMGEAQLFTTMPPFGWSVNRIFYAILLLTAVILLASWFKHKKANGKKFARMFIGVFLMLWLIFDLRMGLETMSYAWHDLTSYAWKPPGQKIFRNYQNLYDVIEQSLPHIKNEPHFVFRGPPKTPFLGIARYLAYPSTPLLEGDDTSSVHHWLIFRRPDIGVTNGRLTMDGKPITGSGEIIQDFDETSFLFRIR